LERNPAKDIDFSSRRQSQCVASGQRNFELCLHGLAERNSDAVSEGFDPTIGIMHESSDGSAAFVFDLMEPERPATDLKVLEFIKGQRRAEGRRRWSCVR
jgi:CRISPR associated protein Cas1